MKWWNTLVDQTRSFIVEHQAQGADRVASVASEGDIWALFREVTIGSVVGIACFALMALFGPAYARITKTKKDEACTTPVPVPTSQIHVINHRYNDMRAQMALVACSPAILWMFDMSGTVKISRGLGLAEYGLMDDQSVGSNVLDWPNSSTAQIALKRFQSGERAWFVSIEKGLNDIVATNSYAPKVNNRGELVGVSVITIPHKRIHKHEC